MNGPSPMYRLKPVFKLPEKIELPTCMYTLKNPVACVNSASPKMPAKESDCEVPSDIADKKPLPEITTLQARWDVVMKQLAALKEQMAVIKTTINSKTVQSDSGKSDVTVLNGAVINASTGSPPYSLLLLRHLLKDSLQLSFTCHVHSSVSCLPESLDKFRTTEDETSCNKKLKLLLIWKEDLSDAELVVNPVKQLPLRGEVNILRYLGRLGLKILGYPDEDMVVTIQADSILDNCHRLLHVRTVKERASLYRNLNAKLGRNNFFGGEELNICDIAAWSALKQVNINAAQDLSQNMAKWYERINGIVN